MKLNLFFALLVSMVSTSCRHPDNASSTKQSLNNGARQVYSGWMDCVDAWWFTAGRDSANSSNCRLKLEILDSYRFRAVIDGDQVIPGNLTYNVEQRGASSDFWHFSFPGIDRYGIYDKVSDWIFPIRQGEKLPALTRGETTSDPTQNTPDVVNVPSCGRLYGCSPEADQSRSCSLVFGGYRFTSVEGPNACAKALDLRRQICSRFNNTRDLTADCN